MRKIKASSRFDKMRIVADNSPRGGVIAIPVARQAVLDTSRTASNGRSVVNVDGDVFDQIVKNFEAWPQPVNVYFGHATKDNPRKPDTPAIGVVTGIWVEGDSLWNEINLGPRAWDLIVVQKGFNAASIEADADLGLPTGDFEGYAEYGLSITNNPALPVQYIAAESGTTGRVSVQLSAEWAPADAEEEAKMAAITLESLQAENTALKAELESNKVKKTRLEDLQAENADLKKRPDPTVVSEKDAKILTLEAQVADLSKRPTVEKILEVEGTVRQIQLERTADQVRSIVASAVSSGKAPAFFEGCSEDPIKFLNERFGGNVAALKASADKLPVVAKMGGTQGPGSGSQPNVSGSPRETIQAEITKRINDKKAKDYAEAIAQVKAEMPALFAEVAASYAPPPSDLN